MPFYGVTLGMKYPPTLSFGSQDQNFKPQ